MSKVLAIRYCALVECGAAFQPKPGGNNAKYCSINCKNTRYREALPVETRRLSRQQSFVRVKADPTRYVKHLNVTMRRQRSIRTWLADYKLERGCVDCGYKKHFAALQLDHEGPKSDEIANCRSSVKRLLEEIDKGQCQVRCANCHAERTWERKRPHLRQLKEDAP